ncbi:MAG: bifunctional RNase H/acid phosphatase [Actinomycetota bacterium]|nr:bifunctional RNase H/acid phosphatase [Actinomycetota bacterium]
MSRRLVVEADGGSRGNPGPAGYGALVRDADTGELLAEVAAGIGVATNNVAEYRGLIAGLAAAVELDPAEVEVRMDSKLVVEQMSGRWQVKHPDMRVLRVAAADVVRRLPAVRFRHIPRAQNSHADRLANEAMDAAARGQAWERREFVARPRAEAAAPDSSAPGNRLAGWMDAPSAPTATLLLRHGQTALSVEKRFSGTGDPPLTALGQAQAVAAGRRLAGRSVAVVVSSPLGRARATARAVAAAVGLDVVVDDGLRETDFGDWEGFTLAEVRAKWPDELTAWLADADVAPPSGESFTATARRVRQARDRVLAAYPGQTVLVVSHVTPIKTLVRIAMEAPPVALYRLHLDLASLTEIDWYADGPGVLRSFNDTGHLIEQPG